MDIFSCILYLMMTPSKWMEPSPPLVYKNL
ncbi:hypothetical protein Avbf_11089 [Armadillidium vulgare]|nr:hypothetical protein Avbf_11089 [Armadillidium vulgare]